MNAKLTVEEARQRMFEDGFTYVSAWQDAPGLDYGTHTHRDRVGIMLLSGSIEITYRDRKLILKEGERLEVPAGFTHGTKVGLQGAVYVLGEMVAGDADLIPITPAKKAKDYGSQW